MGRNGVERERDAPLTLIGRHGVHQVAGEQHHVSGLGRGAGNCQIELLLGFLHNPKYHLRPILQCLQDHVEPMREELRWGFAIPYMVTGYLNQHPKAAMEFMEQTDGKEIVKFYDSAID